MVARKAKVMTWAEVMDQTMDMPPEERAKPLAQRVAEAEELLLHPETWGPPVQIKMGRPKKGEARDEVENMSFRAPRALKEAFTAAAETQGVAPSELLRMLATAYVRNMSPKVPRQAGTAAGGSMKATAKPQGKRRPRRAAKA